MLFFFVKPVSHILFVCTGNICRSPMAEGLWRTMLPGVSVASAGVSAVAGSPASAHAVAAVRAAGGDLDGFHSQPLTAALVEKADYIFTMTHGHLDIILTFFPEAADKTFLLTEFLSGPEKRSDIADPIGQGPDVYNKCRDSIHAALTSISQFLKKP